MASEQMTPEEAYTISLAVMLHFNPRTSYDYFKYNGQLKNKKGSVATKLNAIKWSMIPLCRHLTEEEFPYFCALTIYNNSKATVKELKKKENFEVFRNWQDRQNHRIDLLKNELSGLNIIELGKRQNGDTYPKLYSMIGDKIGIDIFTILDTYLGITKFWNQELKNDFAYTHWVGRYRKFRSFIYEYMTYDRVAYANTIDILIQESRNEKKE